MKITFDIDCTPEEARRLMGLPDLAPVHEKYVLALTDAMDGTVRPELVETMMKGWMPMGEAGLQFWRKLIDSGSGSAPTGR